MKSNVSNVDAEIDGFKKASHTCLIASTTGVAFVTNSNDNDAPRGNLCNIDTSTQHFL